ncbi:MAG: MBOAT family protein [Pirellulales bacterium]|nr:MBOAT family protein [Pirellulales bacterium]
MLFNSVTYLVLLAITVPLWWLLPRRPRLWVVFISSVLFYGFWRFDFLGLLALNSVIDYVVALALDKTENPRRRWALLLTSLVTNLGLLMFFKYAYFLTDNANGLMALLGIDREFEIPFKIILPLGISFYTFQTLSYTIDVFRRNIPAERDFILYADFVIFFPQLVAGPILRASEVMTQLCTRNPFHWADVAQGFRRILYGLFLKVCLADNIAGIVDTGFNQDVSGFSALDVWTLAFLFGFQIYFDFAGYSHIAIGSANLMGIHFPENFNFPYMATSPRDFWRRWHISLSSWIRDYLYLPLAGVKAHDHSSGGLAEATSAEHTGRRDRALFLSWAIMGLWHGANWTFLVWGLWHACFVFLYRTTRGVFGKLPAAVQALGGWGLTLAIAMLGWVPFRAATLSDTFTMWKQAINPLAYRSLNLFENTYVVTAALFVLTVATYVVDRWVAPKLRQVPLVWIPLESIAFAFLIAAVFIYLRPIRQYIYFQF